MIFYRNLFAKSFPNKSIKKFSNKNIRRGYIQIQLIKEIATWIKSFGIEKNVDLKLSVRSVGIARKTDAYQPGFWFEDFIGTSRSWSGPTIHEALSDFVFHSFISLVWVILRYPWCYDFFRELQNLSNILSDFYGL